MDAEKLYRVADDVLTEIADSNVASLLSDLSSYIAQNTEEGFTSANEAQRELNVIFDGSVTALYAPTYLEIIELLGAADYVGKGGKAALGQILAGSPLSLVTSLQAYVATFNELVPKLQKLIESLDEIGIEPYRLDQYEIGYVIPTDLNNLEDVAKRLKHYNKFIALTSAIAGETDNTVHLKRVSNGSLEFFIAGGIGVAKLVDKVLQRVIGLYQEVQKMKKISADIDSIKANTLKTKTEALANLTAMQQEYSDKFVGETVEQVMDGYEGNPGQKEEIATQLGVTIKLLLKDIQSGIKVEVTPPDTKVADGGAEVDGAMSKVAESIASTNANLIGLYSKPRSELRLPSGLDATKDEEKKLDKAIKPKQKSQPEAVPKKSPKKA